MFVMFVVREQRDCFRETFDVNNMTTDICLFQLKESQLETVSSLQLFLIILYIVITALQLNSQFEVEYNLFQCSKFINVRNDKYTFAVYVINIT